ncbi:MAG: family 20 glycosylhydrolase [Saprospiraceae bacterium]|nr:family 20 glycosylhydrolase [Saprospiraceae bacterium]
MKTKTLLVVLLLSTIQLLSAQTNPATKTEVTPLSIVPQPTKLIPVTGSFIISARTQFIVPNDDKGIREVAQYFADRLKIDGTKVPVIDINDSKSTANVVFFLKSSDDDLGTEGYKLSVTPTQININAATPQGFFYAVQTLLQALPSEIFSQTPFKAKLTWRVPCVEIEDRPRYAYRGLHLDVGRHFQPVSFIKKYIDLMALHKYNNFHWHLTEDQGWRIQIKKYPKLTEIGAWRKETLIGHNSDKPKKYDGQRYGGYYTQDDIREVVAYAKARFINIVPEIEMPGHALAALAAYPELSCDPSKKYEVATDWGVFKDVFCPSETTFSFLQDVLTEVMDLFPSKYIHIGGDECPKDAWKKSTFCQDLMKKQGLKDEHELQSYFIQRIEKFINSKGRKIIGWDEILEGGLAPNATVMSWRGTEGGIEAAQHNHDVIMTPGSHCYFDHYQAEPSTEPLAIGGLLPLEKVYSYEPTPDVLNAEQGKRVIGAQGNVWTEYLRYYSQVEYMTYPRAVALAEVLWTPKNRRDYDNFTQRLQAHFKRLERMNVNYANHLYNVKISISTSDSDPSVVLYSPAKDGEIHYTTDGSQPSLKSPLYTKPFDLKSAQTIKAVQFKNGRPLSKTAALTVFAHSALGQKYTLTNPPKNTYESGSRGLTNGLRGNEKVLDQWTGFEGNDMEVFFDFGQARSFQMVEMQFLNRPSAWIFLPDYVIVSVSNDGKEWLDIDRADFEHSRSNDKTYIKEAKLRFSEYTKPKRYLKIYAKNMGVCPKGHLGEGKPAWLFADEILID